MIKESLCRYKKITSFEYYINKINKVINKVINKIFVIPI